MSVDLIIPAFFNTLLTSLSLGIDLVLDNVYYVPVQGTPYAKLSHFPDVPKKENLGPGSWRVWEGVFQVELHYPVGQGSGPILAKAGAICNAASFTPGTESLYQTKHIIIDEVWRENLKDTPSWHELPIKIHYQAFS